MCNLYSMTRSHNEVARLFGVNRDRTGNRPPLPAIFPDQLAPVVRRDTDGARSLDMMRWGFPPPPRSKEKQTTNVRRTESSWWRPWLKREFRCLVPATSFCEYTDATPRVPHWFALSADRPLFAFAGIWRPWTGVRGTKAERQTLVDETGSDSKEHLVFAFLTTEPNDVVRPIHAKAMPVILTGEACDLWLEGELAAALKFQAPAPNDLMSIVATGKRQDALPDGTALT